MNNIINFPYREFPIRQRTKHRVNHKGIALMKLSIQDAPIDWAIQKYMDELPINQIIRILSAANKLRAAQP